MSQGELLRARRHLPNPLAHRLHHHLIDDARRQRRHVAFAARGDAVQHHRAIRITRASLMPKVSWTGLTSMIFISASVLVNSSSIGALPPPASTWHWAQFECRYERTRGVRSCVLS